MKNQIIKPLFMLMSIFGSLFGAKAQNNGHIKVLSQSEYHGVLDKGEPIQLIDVRTPAEYANGKIANAENINVLDATSFDKAVAKLDKTKPVYVYCQSGGRSAKASKMLTDKGFEVVYDLKGGYSQWQDK